MKKTTKKLTVGNGQLTAKRGKKTAAATTRRKGWPLSKRELASLNPPEEIAGIPPALAGLAVPITQLHADPDNARRHPDRNIEAIMASLAKFGQQAPAVFVLRKGKKIIIKGNGLLAAAKALGWTRLAAVRSGLAEQDAKAYAIADNRTTDLSEFDEKLLALQLRELEEASYDLTAVGFSEAELQSLLKDATGEEEDEEGEGGEMASRKRGERTALVIVGHLKFELPRVEFDCWLAGLEAKVGNDPDRVVREIKRRLGLAKAEYAASRFPRFLPPKDSCNGVAARLFPPAAEVPTL
jgi:ParB-like chromosome segregation protein Spo0J